MWINSSLKQLLGINHIEISGRGKNVEQVRGDRRGRYSTLCLNSGVDRIKEFGERWRVREREKKQK